MTTRSIFTFCFAFLAGLSLLRAEPVCTESFDQTATGALPKGWRVSGGEWQVKDGKLVGKGTAYLSRIFAPVGELADVAIEAEVSFLAAKKPSRWLALMVRAEKGEPRPFLIFTSRFERHKGSGLEIGFNQPIKGKREWEIHRRGRRGPALKLGEPQRMRLELRSGLARAFLNGKLVFSCDVSPDVPARGEVGFVVSDVTATFDKVRIEKLPPEREGTARGHAGRVCRAAGDRPSRGIPPLPGEHDARLPAGFRPGGGRGGDGCAPEQGRSGVPAPW